VNQKAYVICNFDYHIETEVLFKVTDSYIHCKNGNISDVMQDTTDH